MCISWLSKARILKNCVLFSLIIFSNYWNWRNSTSLRICKILNHNGILIRNTVETNGKNTNFFSGRAWTPKCTTKDKYRNQSIKKGVELICYLCYMTWFKSLSAIFPVYCDHHICWERNSMNRYNELIRDTYWHGLVSVNLNTLDGY